MAGKRKDKKGRVLKEGESQRPNGTYMYRYSDIHDKRQYIYAKTLDELRIKEQSIQRDLMDGIDYSGSEITVSELVDRYMNLKRSLSPNSKRAYSSAVNRIKKSSFGRKKVKNVRLSDAKTWYISLHDSGMKQNTITVLHSVLRPAFEMAVDDDLIRKNPFKFKLSDIIANDMEKRRALTKQEQEEYLRFIQSCGQGNYYDDIVILLGTGLRVSELYGLTKADIDFENRFVHVRRQLCRTADRPYFIAPPKTKSGIRSVPMSDTVAQAFQRVFENRPKPKIEMIIDGCTGFLFLDKDGRPKVAMHLENYMRCMRKRYAESEPAASLKVTPHVLRHTFCTNMQQAGIDVKSLQYIMGHSNVSVTLDVYTHTDLESVSQAFEKAAVNL